MVAGPALLHSIEVPNLPPALPYGWEIHGEEGGSPAAGRYEKLMYVLVMNVAVGAVGTTPEVCTALV